MRFFTSLLGLGLALGFSTSVWAMHPQIKCVADKLKVTGKLGFCLLKAESKGLKKDEPPDYGKCVDKFQSKWPVIEGKAGGACPTNGDQDAMESEVANHVERMFMFLDGDTLPGIGSDRVGCLCDNIFTPTGNLEACIDNPTCDAAITELFCDSVCMTVSGDSSALEACSIGGCP